MTSIVGLALTLGVCLFAQSVFLILGVTDGVGDLWSMFWFIPVLAVVCAIALAALVVCGRRFRSAPRGPRVATAIVCVASLGLVTYLILAAVEVL